METPTDQLPLPEKPFNKPVYFLGLVLSFLLGAAFMYGTQQLLIPQASKEPTTQLAPTPISSSSTKQADINTENWASYNNQELGVSFKYPSIYVERAVAEDYLFSAISKDYAEMSLGPAGSLAQGSRITLTRWQNTEDISLSQLADPEQSLPANIENREQITIQNQDVIIFHFRPDGSHSFNLQFIKNGSIFDLALTYAQDQEVHQQMFDQILSTFKFTETDNASTSPNL